MTHPTQPQPRTPPDPFESWAQSEMDETGFEPMDELDRIALLKASIEGVEIQRRAGSNIVNYFSESSRGLLIALPCEPKAYQEFLQGILGLIMRLYEGSACPFCGEVWHSAEQMTSTRTYFLHSGGLAHAACINGHWDELSQEDQDTVIEQMEEEAALEDVSDGDLGIALGL